MDATLRDELRQHRAEASESVHRFGDSLVQAQTALGQTQAQQIEMLRAGFERQVDALRDAVDQRRRKIQQDNATRLEQMRQTVDEKLQSTLETRLGNRFATLVSASNRSTRASARCKSSRPAWAI